MPFSKTSGYRLINALFSGNMGDFLQIASHHITMKKMEAGLEGLGIQEIMAK